MEKTEALGMTCPVCHVDLVMSERHGVEIDYCPKCRGIWLDRGELDKIVEKAAAAAQPAPQPASFLPQGDPNAAPWGGQPASPPRYRDDRDWDRRRDDRDHDHDHHGDHRRGGWLGRLID